MSPPVTFTTEAERLKAREQYVRICHAVDIASGAMRIGDWYYESRFDATFPPIAPPPPWAECLVAATGRDLPGGALTTVRLAPVEGAVLPPLTCGDRVRLTKVEVDDA